MVMKNTELPRLTIATLIITISEEIPERSNAQKEKSTTVNMTTNITVFLTAATMTRLNPSTRMLGHHKNHLVILMFMTTSTETDTEVSISPTLTLILASVVLTTITRSQMMTKDTTATPHLMMTTISMLALEISATGMRAQTSAMLTETNASTESSFATKETPTAVMSIDQVVTWQIAA